MRRRRARALDVFVLAAIGAGACGPAPRDLFVVSRTGAIPGADLTLQVSDAGLVRCNGGPPRRLADQQVLDARELARQLTPFALRRLRLPPGPGAVLTYSVRLPDGTIVFSDTSRGLPPAVVRVQGFVRAVSKGVCRLAR